MKFSTMWKKSRKPRKQRLYRHNAPLHIKKKLVAAHLSKELREKYGTRSLGLKKGDKVKIARGQFKGKTGAVEYINTKKDRVIVNGTDITKKDGTKARFPIRSSNLIIVEFSLDDKMRQKIIDRKGK